MPILGLVNLQGKVHYDSIELQKGATFDIDVASTFNDSVDHVRRQGGGTIRFGDDITHDERHKILH